MYISVTISMFLVTISRQIVSNVSKSLNVENRSIMTTKRRLFVTISCYVCYKKSSFSRHFCYDNGVLRKVDEKSTISYEMLRKVDDCSAIFHQ